MGPELLRRYTYHAQANRCINCYSSLLLSLMLLLLKSVDFQTFRIHRCPQMFASFVGYEVIIPQTTLQELSNRMRAASARLGLISEDDG